MEKIKKKTKKQARQGFRPLSAMKGIGYFQNFQNFLRNCLDFFFGEICFWRSFWEVFMGEFLGGILCLHWN